jgi:hypothetical protein
MKTRWETVRVKGTAVVDSVAGLIREGNVRRVVVKHDKSTIAEFPLTVGVVGAVAAPMLAALGALTALLADCTIVVERREDPAMKPRPRAVRARRPRTSKRPARPS